MPWLSNRNDGLKSPRLRGKLAPLCNSANRINLILETLVTQVRNRRSQLDATLLELVVDARRLHL
jgi:hypothetical protein